MPNPKGSPWAGTRPGLFFCLAAVWAAAAPSAIQVQIMPPWHVSQPWSVLAKTGTGQDGYTQVTGLASVLPYLLPPMLDALSARGYPAFPALYATALPYSANFPSKAMVEHFLAREPAEQGRYFTLVPIVYRAQVVSRSLMRASDFEIHFRLELYARDASGRLGALIFGKDFSFPFTASESRPGWEDIERALPGIAADLSRLPQWDTVAALIPSLSKGFSTRFEADFPDTALQKGGARLYFAQAEAFGNFRGDETRIAKSDFLCVGRTGRSLDDLAFPYQADERWPEFLYAAILRPDGTVIRVPPSEAHIEQSPGAIPGKIYDWSRVLVVNLPGLVPGSIVTYAVRFHKRYGLPSGRAFPDPELAKDFRVFPADGRGFRIHAWSGPGDTIRFAAHHAILDSVVNSSVSGFPLYEVAGHGIKPPRGGQDPGEGYFYPVVRISNRKDWADLLAESRDSVFARIPPVRRVPAPLARKAVEDSILGIHRFIHDSLRYVALEFGSRAYVPAPPESTLARKMGDCKDFAVLMIARLRASGVDAFPAVVGGRSRNSLFPGPPSYDAIDHMIVHIPSMGLWVDPTDGVLPPAVLPYNLSGAQALILAPDSIRMRPMPSNAEEDYEGRTVYDCREEGPDLACERRWIFSRANSWQWRDFLKDTPRPKWPGLIHPGVWEAACRMTETGTSVEHLDDERQGLEIHRRFIGRGAVWKGGGRTILRMPETPFSYLFQVVAMGDTTGPLMLDTPIRESVEVRISTPRPLRWPPFRDFARGNMYLRMSRPGPDRVVVEVGLPAGEIAGDDRRALMEAVGRYKDFFSALLMEG